MACNPVHKEPDYTASSYIVDISANFDVDDSIICHTLSSVAANNSLGDTNVAVPGRLLGCVEAYVEAGALD